MSAPKVGDKFPDDVTFEWAPIQSADPKTCPMPQAYNASKEFQGKRVVVVSVPGAFTPACQGKHVGPFFENVDKMVQKGVDIVAIIATNDPFVMNAWGKINGADENCKILFMSDTKTKLGQHYGWMAGLGDRNGRWAIVVEKDGTISYAENEKSVRDVTVSGAESILAKL